MNYNHTKTRRLLKNEKVRAELAKRTHADTRVSSCTELDYADHVYSPNSKGENAGLAGSKQRVYWMVAEAAAQVGLIGRTARGTAIV